MLLVRFPQLGQSRSCLRLFIGEFSLRRAQKFLIVRDRFPIAMQVIERSSP